MHKFQLETKDDKSVLICTRCNRPFLDIENGELRIKTKHGSKDHENFLTLEHIRMIGFEMYRQTHPPERF